VVSTQAPAWKTAGRQHDLARRPEFQGLTVRIEADQGSGTALAELDVCSVVVG